MPATLHIPSIPCPLLPLPGSLVPWCPTPLYFLSTSLFYGHFGHLHPAPGTQMDTFRSASVESTQPYVGKLLEEWMDPRLD